MIAVFRALIAGRQGRPAAPGARIRALGFAPLTGRGVRLAAAFCVGAFGFAGLAPSALAQRAPSPEAQAQAQAQAACRTARDALRDMVHRMVEAQTLRESCGRSEPALQAAVGELEAYAAGRLAAMDPAWPMDGIRSDVLRLREMKRLEHRRLGVQCAGQEPLDARLRQVAEARALVVAEERPGGAFACTVR